MPCWNIILIACLAATAAPITVKGRCYKVSWYLGGLIGMCSGYWKRRQCNPSPPPFDVCLPWHWNVTVRQGSGNREGGFFPLAFLRLPTVEHVTAVLLESRRILLKISVSRSSTESSHMKTFKCTFGAFIMLHVNVVNVVEKKLGVIRRRFYKLVEATH